ncbi:MAG: helix-turn-helix domain-containing protein [Clostridia bacterium]|nr:helix-turn-helix domain-containing protein [Clostridia bacterium]
MKFSDSQPFVRKALLGRLDSSKKNDLFIKLKTKDSRLFYILSGSGSIKIEDIEYPVIPDSVILFKAGTEYEYRIDELDYYVVNFDFDKCYSHVTHTFHPFHSKGFDANSIFDCGRIEDQPQLERPIVLENAVTLKRQIKNIVTESSISDSFTQNQLSCLLKSLIIDLLRLQAGSPHRAADELPLIKQIIEYVHENYKSGLSNSDVARHFGYNPSYIGRLFKRHTGYSLHELVLELRLETAMELLASQDLSVGEVCRLSGFTDTYHFSKTFKQRTGVTPTGFKNRHVKEQGYV